jgi:hypothetical protein
MKTLNTFSILLASCFFVGSLASAQARSGSLSTTAQEIANQLASVERDLSPRDRQQIQYSLDQLSYLLSPYNRGGSSSHLSCISNGSGGAFEKFYVTDLDTNQQLGGATSAQTCRKLIDSQNAGLICVSNGSGGAFEKFSVYDVSARKEIGGASELNLCIQTVTSASRDFVCVSNGSGGAFEKFALYNRRTGQKIGGETNLQNCLISIPK